MDINNDIHEDLVTFSRRKHSNSSHKSTEIFIPNDEEGKRQNEANCRKECAMLLLLKIENVSINGEQSNILVIPILSLTWPSTSHC